MINEKVLTGEFDVNNKPIFYNQLLQLPDGSIGQVMFDAGQLAAYFADEKGYCIVELTGVNNHKSFYLKDCKIIE